MKVAVIDYNAGNTRSVYFAMQRAGVDAVFTKDHVAIKSADKVIFPGVGEANTTMEFLRRHQLDDLICGLKQPVLGICLGMQLMCNWSEENDTECLGIFDTDVRRFKPTGSEKVPHMGWNQVYDLDSTLFPKELEQRHVYFVHSFYVPIGDDTAARCDYCQPFSAALHKNNFYATQFHPEKSGPVGAAILKHFLEI